MIELAFMFVAGFISLIVLVIGLQIVMVIIGTLLGFNDRNEKEHREYLERTREYRKEHPTF